MRIIQSRSFARKVKKFAKREKKKLDEEIRKILDNPSVGSEKKGDLRGVFVHKFKISTNQYPHLYGFHPAGTQKGRPRLIRYGEPSRAQPSRSAGAQASAEYRWP